MKKLLIGAIAILLSAAPARADWQFSEWGMTKEEFKQKSTVEIRDKDKVCENLLVDAREMGKDPQYLASDWKAGTIKFTNCYLFGEDNSLSGVVLDLDNFRSTKLVYHLLVEKYGYTTLDKSIESSDIFWYEWHTDENKITFIAEKISGKVKTRVIYHNIQPSLSAKVSEEEMLRGMEKHISDTKNICLIFNLSFENPPSALCKTYLDTAPKYLEKAKASSSFEDRMLHYKAFQEISNETMNSFEPYFEKLTQSAK